MRRRFNKNICITKPPIKGTKFDSHIGSPFNRWFRHTLKGLGITSKAFSELIEVKYVTVMTWRYKNNPTFNFRADIARGLEHLGYGTYADIMDEMKQLCRK